MRMVVPGMDGLEGAFENRKARKSLTDKRAVSKSI